MVALTTDSTSTEFLNYDQNSTVTAMDNTTVNVTVDEDLAEVGKFLYSPEAYAVPILFAIIFIVGVVGNGILIFIVLRNKNMRNTPNIFIVSLAFGDLLLIVVSVPFIATLYTFSEWPYGQGMCKLTEFLRSLSLGVSVFTLTALSADRYIAIVDPLKKHKGNPTKRTMLVAGGIWVLSIALAIPDAISAHSGYKEFGHKTFVVCEIYLPEWGEYYPRYHVMFRFIVYFAIPIMIIGVFYAMMARMLILSMRHIPGGHVKLAGPALKQLEGRKRVAYVVLSFVTVFVICWLPRHIYLLWYCYDPGLFNMFWHIFKIVGFCLSFINSCVNPLALYMLSRQFRHYYNCYLFCCCNSGYPRVLKRDDTQSTLLHINSTRRGSPTTMTSSLTNQTAC